MAETNDTTRREIPFLAIIREADPEFLKEKSVQVEYEFRGRTFSADQTVRGPYNDNPNEE